jgi:hypothetical protein
MAVPTLAVLDREPARHDRAALLESLARLAQGVRVEPELRFQILDRARTRGREMPDELRAVVLARLGLLERGAAQRVGRAGALGGEEQRLPAVELRLEDVLVLRDLATPAPLRLRPRGEALLRRVVRLLVRRAEETRQAGVLRQGEQLAIGQEREGVVERPQLPVGSEPAVTEPSRAQLV